MSSCPGVPYSRRFAEHQNEGTPAEHDSKIDMTGPLALLLCSGILGMAQVSSSTSRGPMSISISITSLPPRFLEKRGPGLHHVAMRVPDLHATVRRLESARVRLMGMPRRGAGGHLYVFVHPAGTGGVLWELIQD